MWMKFNSYYYFFKSTLFLVLLLSWCNAFDELVLFDTGQAQTVLPFKYTHVIRKNKYKRDTGLMDFSILM